MLRAIAAWREREAQRINIPRQRLLKDETLLEIAATAPDTPSRLARARGIIGGFAEGRSGAVAAGRHQGGQGAARCALPEAPRGTGGPRPSPALVVAAEGAAGRASARSTTSRPSWSPVRDDIDRLATEEAPDMPALHGWRREVFGDDALALKAGRLALGVDGRRIKLIAAG